MDSKVRFKSLTVLLFTAVFGLGCALSSIAQDNISKEMVSPIKGKLMLVGSGEISSSVGATFTLLAGD